MSILFGSPIKQSHDNDELESLSSIVPESVDDAPAFDGPPSTVPGSPNRIGSYDAEENSSLSPVDSRSRPASPGVSAEEIIEEPESSSEFKLSEELRKIDCTAFVDALSSAGYDNEGAFSELEEEDLQATNLWIPKRARVRILTLAGALKRRVAVFSQQKDAKSYKNFEKNLVGTSALKVLTIEGDDNVYTTMAALQAALKKKKADELREQNQVVEDPHKPKDHSADVQALIVKIRRFPRILCSASLLLNASTHVLLRDCVVDEFGVSLNQERVRPHNKYCCTKHEIEATEARRVFIERRRLSTTFDLRNRQLNIMFI